MRQRPARKYVRLVLLLRAAWLVPVTLMALAYSGYSGYFLLKLMRYQAAAAALEFAEALFGAALGAAFLFFTWRMWRKTWDMLLNRVYPERSALAWQICWIMLAVVLPFLVMWPKVKDVLRYSGEGANKGNLAALRAAAEDYKAARGVYPPGLAALAASGFIRELPPLWDSGLDIFPHARTNAAAVYEKPEARDSGGWAYSLRKGSAPLVFIDCVHRDSRGAAWSVY
jgi:hypothetical protein